MYLNVPEYNTLRDLQKAFPDDESCLRHIVQLAYTEQGGKSCEKCGCKEYYYMKRRRVYQCKRCDKLFSPLAGTIFENTKISLVDWFQVIHIITSHKKGASSLHVSRETKITQATAWHICHKVREVLDDYDTVALNGIKTTLDTLLHELEEGRVKELKKPANFKKFSGEVEIDEMYFGGRNKNRHTKKKLEGVQGLSQLIKFPVFGMYERSTGRVKCVRVSAVDGPTLLAVLKEYVEVNTIIHGDGLPAYEAFVNDYTVINTSHSEGLYERDGSHTNNMERVWSMLRRGVMGNFHHISEKHIDRYLSEFSFRISFRKLTQQERFDAVIRNCKKVVTYKDITDYNGLHNYSGRGNGYDNELQAKTRKRGAFTKEQLSMFEERGIDRDYRKRRWKTTDGERYPHLLIPAPAVIEVPIVDDGKPRKGRPPGSKNKKGTKKNDASVVRLQKIMSKIDAATLEKLVAAELKSRAQKK